MSLASAALDLLVEMLHHHRGLLADGVRIALHKRPQLLLRPLPVEHGIVIHGLLEPVVARYRRVVGENVEDEMFLDRLLHRIDVERTVLHFAILHVLLAEHLQRLVLGRGREREVRGVLQKPPPFHEDVDLVFVVHVIGELLAGKRDVYLRRRETVLPGVRLVDDNRKSLLGNITDFRGAINDAFSRYYKTTLLCGETDPNKLPSRAKTKFLK